MGAPPGNANAPLAKGRRDTLTGGRGYATCPHSATLTEEMPRIHAHFAREVCAGCGAFIRWLPRPETLARRQMNVARLARLLVCSGLSNWEQQFVRSLSRQKKFSPKQEAVLGRIYRESFGGAAL